MSPILQQTGEIIHNMTHVAAFGNVCQKSPIFYQKSPIFYQKSHIFSEKSTMS